MKDNQDNWEKLINITNEYEPSPDLAKDVILKLNQKESTVKFKKRFPVWAIVFAFFVAVLTMSLLLNFYGKSDTKLYLNNGDLSITEVEDIDKFVIERKLNILYDNSTSCTTKSAVVNTNQKLAYIRQNYFYVSNYGFEEVNLRIVFIDAIYDFSESYKILNEKLDVRNIILSYNIVLETNGNHLYAKFIYNNVEYYLEIKDVTNVETTLNGVISSLINH